MLLVDDDVAFARALAELLREEKHLVRVAHDAAGALELVESQPFDIALIDVKLPDLHGVELFRRIRSARPLARCVLITGFMWDSRLDEARGLGVEEVLGKPIAIERLLELVGG